jgi:hypothetical protein
VTRLDRLKEDFRNCAGTFPYRRFVALLTALGFSPIKGGRTSGARRKFEHGQTGKRIFLDEPHDGSMRPGMVRRLRDDLTRDGYL